MIAEVVIFIEDQNRVEEGIRLSKRLQLPIVNHFETNHIVLTLTEKQLELRFPDKTMKPLAVDFLSKTKEYRMRKSLVRNELIARAVGIKGDYLPSIIDATAGLGSDALILAHFGCQVKMIERSPIIWALLEDGLNRAHQSAPEWLPQLSLFCADAKHFLQMEAKNNRFVDVIYLDPMFPKRSKSALVKKEMRILKDIVGPDEDAEELFNLAKQYARKRVVVKRPRLAKTLTSQIPSIVYKGKACRFDVYLI